MTSAQKPQCALKIWDKPFSKERERESKNRRITNDIAKEAEVSGWHSFDAINAPSFTNLVENATDLYISQHCQIETYFLWFQCTKN